MPLSDRPTEPPEFDAASELSHVDALEQLRREQLSLGRLFFAFHLLCERDDTVQEKRAIVERIRWELLMHVKVVDEIVLPALPDGELDADLVDEARTQHASIQELMLRIAQATDDDPERDAQVEALGEFVDRHLTHERNLLFPRLRAAEQIDLKELGRRVGERRVQLLDQYRDHVLAGSPPEDESDDPVGRPTTH